MPEGCPRRPRRPRAARRCSRRIALFSQKPSGLSSAASISSSAPVPTRWSPESCSARVTIDVPDRCIPVMATGADVRRAASRQEPVAAEDLRGGVRLQEPLERIVLASSAAGAYATSITTFWSSGMLMTSAPSGIGMLPRNTRAASSSPRATARRRRPRTLRRFEPGRVATPPSDRTAGGEVAGRAVGTADHRLEGGVRGEGIDAGHLHGVARRHDDDRQVPPDDDAVGVGTRPSQRARAGSPGVPCDTASHRLILAPPLRARCQRPRSRCRQSTSSATTGSSGATVWTVHRAARSAVALPAVSPSSSPHAAMATAATAASARRFMRPTASSQSCPSQRGDGSGRQPLTSRGSPAG